MDDEPIIKIHIQDGHGYVWTADEALRLRRDYGIIGTMIGGVAVFKQQNLIHGLPLQLSEEEVTLVLEKGWGTLQPCEDIQKITSYTEGGKKRGRPGYFDFEDEDEDSELSDWDEDLDLKEQHEQEKANPYWHDALAKGAAIDIPLQPQDVPGANVLPPGYQPSLKVPEWTFPRTKEERQRHWVFKDLHKRGYRLTGGSKFGCDFLVYPGDPTLYHGQFCVRLVGPDQVMLPALFAAACRGSFQARKHLLIASVIEGESDEQVAAAAAFGSKNAGGGAEEQQQHEGANGEKYRILYMTAGPVEGFG